jgi:sugar lactone lactonase YvrE
MNTPSLCDLRSVFHRPFVLLLAAFIGLAPLSARGQFASILDTTSRFAGTGAVPSVFNGDTGVATATTLNVPFYVVIDSLGNLYVSDKQNNCVRKVATNGQITTVAGLRVSGGADTCNPATGTASDPSQGLLAPTGLAIDSNNTLYIADSQHNCVRSLASGTVDSFASPALTTVAGTCTIVNTNSDTPAPDGLAVDSNSNLYISIADSLTGNPAYQVVRHLASDSATTICYVAGDPSIYAATTMCSGIANTVELSRPAGLAFDKNGNLFIADSNNDCVREIVGMTTQTTPVGQCNNDNSGSLTTALNNPYGLAFSADGSLFISESESGYNHVVSFNSGTNSLALIAGLSSGASGPYNLSQEGQAASLVPLNQPLGVTTDAGGNIYLADSQNNIVRKLGTNLSFPNTNVGSTSASQTIVFSINQTVNLTLTVGTDFNLVSTTCNGAQSASTTCQVVIAFSPSRPGYRYSALQLKDSISGKLISVELRGLGIGPLSLLAPGVASTRASSLRTAIAVSTDSAGDAYVLEQGNGSSTADVLFYPAGGGAAQVVVAQGAGMVTPTAMAVDGAGNIFIADSGIGGLGGGNIIRFGADGSVNTSYATGLPGVNSMAFDGFDDLFLAIGGSFHNITEIYAGGQRRVVAGNGTVPDANNVVATSALFSDPSGIALWPNGIAVADAATHYVYSIDNSGIIHIVAGNGTTTTTNATIATGTGLLTPYGLAIDAAGDIYIADGSANRVYAVYSVISNGSNIYPVIGTGTAGYTGDGGPSTAATINAPLAIALDGSSDLFVIDSGNSALREVTYPVTSYISFGSVLVGATSSPVLQYLANAGNANLAFSLYPFTTTDSHYAVSPGSTTCTATTVSGGVCDIAYTFSPTVAGAAPPGQSNLISNSYNSQQTVIFSTSGSSGYSSGPLPFTLIPETEVFGYSFPESFTFTGSSPASGTMIFYIGSQVLCTATISNASAGTITCNAPPSGLAVGSYTVSFTFTSTNSYYSSVTGTIPLAITRAPLTVTPNNFSRQYGQTNPAFTGIITGAVNGDVFTASYSTTATQLSPVGTYPITATLTPVGSANLNNYSVTYNTGTLTIAPAGSGGSGGLVVTPANATRQYGTPNPPFNGTITGAVNGDNFTATYSTTATQFSPVGTYPITATLTPVGSASFSNYSVTYNVGTLTITPSATALVVTVNNATRPYGTPNPTFTGSISGALNGDTFTVTYSTTATILSPVGAYPITATLSGAAAANYSNVTVNPGTLTVTQATTPLVVTVNNASRPYGTPNPTFTGSITGALNGDTFTVTYATAATILSPIGTYPITAIVSGASAANYNVTVVPGTLTITPATTPLVIAVNNTSRPYAATNPTFTSTITGALNGDTFTVTYATTATILSPVGAYPIAATLSGAAAANYNNVTVIPGTLTITPAATPLVITANNATRPYGTPNPTFTGSITGALNGDTFTVTYSTPATIASPVGNYAITAAVTGANIANYATVTVVPGTLIITPATTPLVITVNNATRPYGTPNPTFTSTITGALNGDTFTVTYSTLATIASPVGNYAITAIVSGASAANYNNVTVNPGTLTVTQATTPLVVSVNNASRPYGAPNPTFTSTITGAAPGDTFTVTYATAATVLSPIGTYPITAAVTGANIANYATVTVIPGTLTITPSTTPLVITVNNATRPYGTPNPTFTGSIAGALNGDTFTVTYSTLATIASPVGAYPITATLSGAAAANYNNVTVVPGTLTITPATTPLVITVNNATRPYGAPNPTFTGTIAGALNGDTFTVTYSTTATVLSPIGTYPLTAIVSGASAANYNNVTVVPGTLTITPATTPLVVTVNNVARAYGAPNPTFTSAIAGAAPGDTFTVTYATTATALSDVGSYPITAAVSGANIANYATVTVVPGALAITPLATVTTVTTSATPITQGASVTFIATVAAGASVPVTAATVNFYNGTTLLCAATLNSSGVATCTTSTLPVGTLTITAAYQATLDFASSSGTVAQAVNPGSFTLSAAPPNQFISGPGTTVYAVTVSSVQGFAGPVTLACAGLPADASCTFATPTVTLTGTGDGASVSTTMTVTTTMADARLALPALPAPAGRTPSGLSPIAFAAVFPFGLVAFFGLSRRKRVHPRATRSPNFRLLLALLCTAAIVSLAGCACLSSINQVYTIPITGTTSVSGVSSQSTSVSLTVAQE